MAPFHEALPLSHGCICSTHFLHLLHFQQHWFPVHVQSKYSAYKHKQTHCPPLSPQVHCIQANPVSKYTFDVPQKGCKDCTCKHRQEGTKNRVLWDNSPVSQAQARDHSQNKALATHLLQKMTCAWPWTSPSRLVCSKLKIYIDKDSRYGK